MDTWALLKKELEYYGVHLIDNKKCRVYDDDNNNRHKTQGVLKTIRDMNISIKKQKKILLLLWDEIIELLYPQEENKKIIDDQMTSLFIFSLKDLMKFLLCFENSEKSKYYNAISIALNRDIKSFNKQQINNVPDYKISIDWVNRNICRLLYISKLLAFTAIGPKRILQYKIARGISGPFSHLDLPMQERVFPFGTRLQDRTKAKQKQRRYRKGLEHYEGDPRVGEGHYWRELKNEPFDWFNRDFDDPYPSRYLLSR